jgi:hypothetical protein
MMMPNYPKARNLKGDFWCPGCSSFLGKDKFDASKRTFWGIQTWCRACIKLRRIQWHSVRKAVLEELVRKTRKRNRENTLTYNWVHEQWQKQNGRCYYTGALMTHGHGQGRVWTNVSIDRMDSSLGYIPNNCVLCCVGFNLMKTDLSLKDMVKMCRAFLKTYREIL